MRAAARLLLSLIATSAVLASSQRVSPPFPQARERPAHVLRSWKKGYDEGSNPLIAKLQVEADMLRAPTKAKRVCASPLPNGNCVMCSDDAPTLCSGDCVDTTSDSDNCGSCGTACGAVEVCETSACVCDIGNGYEDCSGTCIQLYGSDSDHCGACDYACPDPFICVGGGCSCSAPGYQECGGQCMNTADWQADPYNCGSCFYMCPSTYSCIKGACACASDLTECENTCVDKTSDSSNCGSCDAACTMPGQTTCSGSQCVCDPGYVSCNGVCFSSGVCQTGTIVVNTASSPSTFVGYWYFGQLNPTESGAIMASVGYTGPQTLSSPQYQAGSIVVYEGLIPTWEPDDTTYAIMDQQPGFLTAPGGGPAVAAFDDEWYETGIWTVDSDGTMTASWYNADGTSTPMSLFCINSEVVYVTPNPTYLSANSPPNTVECTFTFIF